MAGGAPSPPPAPDPNTIIRAQEQANRVNRITPFGSQTYGPDGSLTTTLPQGTQTAFNNITELAGNKQQFLQPAQGFGDLQSALMSKVSQRATQQPQKAQTQQFPQTLNGQQVNPAWDSVLSRIYRN